MATALEYVRALAPEFASVSDATVGVLIDAAALTLTPSAWGNVYPMALARLAAHELTLQARAASGAAAAAVGPVTSISTGAMSVGYAASGGATQSAADALLGSTPHGLAYLGLRASRAAVAPLLLS